MDDRDLSSRRPDTVVLRDLGSWADARDAGLAILETQDESGALADARVDVDGPPEIAEQNVVNDRQAESRRLAEGLGREHGVEDLAHDFLGNARALVAHLELYTSLVGEQSQRDEPPALRLARVDGIGDEVGDDPGEPIRRSVDLDGLRSWLERNATACLLGRLGEGDQRIAHDEHGVE